MGSPGCAPRLTHIVAACVGGSMPAVSLLSVSLRSLRSPLSIQPGKGHEVLWVAWSHRHSCPMLGAVIILILVAYRKDWSSIWIKEMYQYTCPLGCAQVCEALLHLMWVWRILGNQECWSKEVPVDWAKCILSKQQREDLWSTTVHCDK